MSLRARLFALSLAAAAAAHAAPSPAECPQPRFTGRAPDAYYTLVNPLPKDADLAAANRLFQGDGRTVACASCHGTKGDGRGEMASMFDPRPSNFACAQTVNGIPDGQLFWIIRFGSPGTSMPPHPKLADRDIWGLVLYLRHLARP